MKRLALILGMLAAAPSAVWAMACERVDGAGLNMYESIGSPVKVPTYVPDGTVIWRGPTRSIAAICRRDQVAYRDEMEPIYFYVNPRDVAASVWGIDFGMRVNGADQWPAGGGEDAAISTGATVPPCLEGAIADCPNSGVFYLSFQPVIRKRGLTPYSPIPDPDYALYQLDGKHGLNVLNNNFVYHITDLEFIEATSCNIDVTVTPSPGIVDFGTVQWTTTGFNPTVPTENFSLILDKSGCDSPIGINGYITTPYSNMDLILPTRNSNFGIRIVNALSGSPISLSTPFYLANFSSTEMRKEVFFRAEMVSFGEVETGPFSATATIEILYY